METGQDLCPRTPSPSLCSCRTSGLPFWGAAMKVLCGHQSAKCSWPCPRDQGQGRVSVGMMPELCIGKLLCKMLKAVARITVPPTPATFFSIYHALSSVPVRKLSCPSPFTFTDEGAECQLARGRAGPAAGAWHLLLWGRLVARSKGARAWGLRTIIT